MLGHEFCYKVVAGDGKDDYVAKEDLTEYAICKKAAFSTAVIHQVFESGCRQVP